MEPEVWIFGALIVIELIMLWFKIIFIVLFTSWKKTKLILPNKSTSKATDVQNFKNQDSSRSKVQNKWLQFCFLFHFQWLLISLMPRKRLLLQESFYFRLLWLKTMVKLILRRSHSTVKCWETLVAIFINDLRECSLRRNLSQPLKIIFICGKTPSNYSSSERKCLCIVNRKIWLETNSNFIRTFVLMIFTYLSRNRAASSLKLIISFYHVKFSILCYNRSYTA